MKIKINFNAEKVVEFDNIKIYLKAITPSVQHYIEELSILAHQEKDDSKRFEFGRAYVKRVICCSVKKIEGLELEVNDKPFELSFKDDKKTELDDLSYDVLVHVFENVLNKDLSQEIFKHYNDKKANTQIELAEDKKKDI